MFSGRNSCKQKRRNGLLVAMEAGTHPAHRSGPQHRAAPGSTLRLTRTGLVDLRVDWRPRAQQAGDAAATW